MKLGGPLLEWNDDGNDGGKASHRPEPPSIADLVDLIEALRAAPYVDMAGVDSGMAKK